MLSDQEKPRNRALRERLDSIMAAYTNERVGEQIRAIAELSKECPHSIRVLAEAVSNEPETFRFTCFQFALDLRAAREIKEIASHQPEDSPLYPGPEFVQYLIKHRLQEVSPDETQSGDLIVYSQGKSVKHAGVVAASGVVISKWGLMHLWLHGTFDLPAGYGDDDRYFKRPPRHECINGFLEFARLHANGAGSAV